MSYLAVCCSNCGLPSATATLTDGLCATCLVCRKCNQAIPAGDSYLAAVYALCAACLAEAEATHADAP